MRSFVRDTVDTDATDLPDTLLDTFLIDGASRVDSASDSWRFREVDYTISTTAAQQAYVVRGSGTLATGITYPLARITDVRGPRWSARPCSHRDRRERNSATTTLTSVYPSEFSLWGDSLYLWPIPSTAGTSVSITGYRDQIDWISVNAAPDFPSEFHLPIAQWAVSRAHAREGDPGLASFYGDQFHQAVTRLESTYTEGLDAQPFQLNIGNDTDNDYRTARALGPLVYTWE